ncbi:cell wall-associated NlpC family hydrolase [Virgibacillus natechei]|uniref:Cell wall-associated NlpC family hydrolase n=1 Tax=Virgibacillus natechei TaxID=1216297 RepID=A0ABS4IBS6_9BACI|nr:NlpC/P60 family protein [Virgibacillus natechei]MBP1967916.1 cell wall-associated NlpC family hydrolase [Virgibacillus natechei]UZD14793.1 NlpC/P60 family protein [Virgibacillus natechei]
MINGTVEHVVKNSLLYSYVLAQPFVAYVEASPAIQNKILLESEQLQYGQHGESVRVLQQKLNKLSYYDDEVDGDYGLLTEHALKKFQEDNSVIIDGQADKETLYALINVELKQYLDTIDKLSETIYPGMHSDDVKVVQKALEYFGYYEGEIDGIYGPLTTKALEITEEEHDIELTEEITQEDLEALYGTAVTEEQEDEVEEESEVEEMEEETETNEGVNEIDKDIEEEKNVKEEDEETKEKEIKKAEVKGANGNNVVQDARSLIGTPYEWGGDTPSGFDCSGFIQYIFEQQDITLPRTVSETWNFAQSVDRPSVGDLVFFETYQPGPSHMGVYIGDGKFIHAGSTNGVEVSELGSSYWESKYIGAKRI